MSINSERLQYLFEKYASGTASSKEFVEFWRLMVYFDESDTLPVDIKAWWNRYDGEYDLSAGVNNQEMLEEIFKKSKVANNLLAAKRRLNGFGRWAAVAAALMVLFGAWSYFYFSQHLKHKASIPGTEKNSLKNDIAPGAQGALLSFSNGKTFLLDTTENGNLMKGVIKSDDNISIQGATVAYATLTTPRGRQQQIILEDGTKVWLNAASSIRFPSSFSGNQRVVEMTGEGYFEVAKNTAMPFVVKVGGSEVQVLGTHFNVMSYSNEQKVITTLLEGAVKFKKGNISASLKPGEQSVLDKNGLISVVRDADLELAVAWKNGQQLFKRADIATIMRQIERWYDVDVEYNHLPPGNITFSGDLPRNVNLSALLKVFERNNLHFLIDGHSRKVIVTE